MPLKEEKNKHFFPSFSWVELHLSKKFHLNHSKTVGGVTEQIVRMEIHKNALIMITRIQLMFGIKWGSIVVGFAVFCYYVPLYI